MMRESKIYLAPMAGITDAAMREVCVLQGAQMTFTEMVSAKGISYQNSKTNALLELGPAEQRAGVQLFGSDPGILAETAKQVQDALAGRLYVIDINMGCPAPKIVNNGEGCALMKTPALARDIIAAVRRAVDVKLSVKFRKGWDDASVNAVEFAKMAEDAGCDAVTVHGRTRMQYYSGRADWDIIGEVKSAVGIEVIGNGDIFRAEDAAALMAHTGCGAVMVARGAQGNPFLFRQINELLCDGEVKTRPSNRERIEMCLYQARKAVEYKGEHLAMLQMRTHTPQYTKGMRNSAGLRARLVLVKTYTELEDVLYGYLGCSDG